MVTPGWFSKMYTKFKFCGSEALYLSFETCYDNLAGVCSYLRHKHKLLVLSLLSGFMTYCECFDINSEGSLFQLWNIVGR